MGSWVDPILTYFDTSKNKWLTQGCTIIFEKVFEIVFILKVNIEKRKSKNSEIASNNLKCSHIIKMG